MIDERPSVRFDADGLAPAIVRDATSRDVLMLAYVNDESLQRMIDTGETWFWSRSRQELWNKGATSGNRQKVTSIALDCDRDTLLIDVEPAGPACHTGAMSCFDAGEPPASLPAGRPRSVLATLERTLVQRKADLPEGSYSAYLFKAGRNKILKKIGEEATEVVIAATNEGEQRLVSEVADLLYHLTALLVNEGVAVADVEAELEKRAGKASATG